MTSQLTPATFAATAFDYVIVGGGTAGLALAARLTENPEITVGVIEAGVGTSSIQLLNPSIYICFTSMPSKVWNPR